MGKLDSERACKKSYGALRTFMQNNPIMRKIVIAQMVALDGYDKPRLISASALLFFGKGFFPGFTLSAFDMDCRFASGREGWDRFSRD